MIATACMTVAVGVAVVIVIKEIWEVLTETAVHVL